MAKSITVPPKPQPSSLPRTPTEWISGSETVPGEGIPANQKLVRLTFDISEDLHQRVKIACARRGIKRMAVELRRILEEKFPPET